MEWLLDVSRLCLSAQSHSSDPFCLPQSMEFGGLMHSAKVFASVMVLPTLAMPFAVLHAYGLYRCGRTIARPYAVPQPVYEPNDIQVVVHRRKYDKKSRKIIEEGCFFDSQTIDYGLKVAGSRRDEFVDDPNDPGVAYFVMERRKINKKFLTQGQAWLWGAMDDFLYFAIPLFICGAFMKPMRHFHTDLKLVLQGRLPLLNVRHPISNFFLSINDYNKAKIRYNTTKAATSRPWSESL